jgi:radical SAM superfamily enzyme YgiQ (UPF0313 family)
MAKSVFVADLSHTSGTNAAYTFPLGAAFVTGYANKVLADRCRFRLFKYSESLAAAIAQEPPDVLACSNYQWNLELTYRLCTWAKQKRSDTVVVFGGPNFPVTAAEKIAFFHNRPVLDFYIEFEGEIGFAGLLQKLSEHGFDPRAFKATRERVVNCTYLHEDELIEGPSERISDVNIIPSPYLTGLMDQFFDKRLVPMVETTRGCPFSCSFCADGMALKSRIFRVDKSRTRQELDYISDRVTGIAELIITDLNFGMYEQDVETAQYIDDIRKRRGWPKSISATAGKNRPERVLKVADILKGAWVTGSAIQSADPEVLKNVRRSNISLDAYTQFTQFANRLDKDSSSYTEIILGLPGDTKEKHFQTLRYSIDSGVKNVRIYQAILLIGTEMASQATRDQYELRTKFRIIADGWGNYDFAGDKVSVAEIEEIVVGSRSLSLDDYLACRVMNLFVEFFHNNGLCEEIVCPLKSLGLTMFDALVFLHGHEELHSPTLVETLASFRFHSLNDLYDSQDEAERFAPKYLSGELRPGDLQSYRGKLYAEIDDALAVLVRAVKALLSERGLLNDAAADYFDEAKDFILCRKRALQDVERVEEQVFSYDFEALDRLGYAIDPRTFAPAPKPIRFTFAHTDVQKDDIRTTMRLYVGHSGGMTSAFKRRNLKKWIRKFAPVSSNAEMGAASAP